MTDGARRTTPKIGETDRETVRQTDTLDLVHSSVCTTEIDRIPCVRTNSPHFWDSFKIFVLKKVCRYAQKLRVIWTVNNTNKSELANLQVLHLE